MTENGGWNGSRSRNRAPFVRCPFLFRPGAWRRQCPYDDPEDFLFRRNDVMLKQTRIMFGKTPADLNAFVEASQIA